MSGADWIRVDVAHILSVMALPALSFYESWVKLMPARAERLEAITAGVVSEFRTALLSNPANRIDVDPTMMPLPCVRYTETLVIAALCREMDKPLSDIEQSQVIRAEITLRTFYTRALLVTAPEKGSGFPTYNRGRRPARITCDRKVPATYVEAPVFDPLGGEMSGDSVSVSVVCATPGAVIRYTVDGSNPVDTSPVVLSGAAVVVPVPGELKARGFKAGMVTSTLAAAYYKGLTAVLEAYFYAAGQVLTDGAAFDAWAATVPASSRVPSPVAGTAFTLAVQPGTASLVIAYPASVREFSSAVQQSTGMQARLAWINSPHSTLIETGGVAYRVYQWVPAFAWENADRFNIML